MSECRDELICPILLDLMEDPITLPCCGKSISREPLKTFVNVNNNCPLCRGDLANTCLDSIPKSVNLAYLIEVEKNKNSIPIVKPNMQKEIEWVGKCSSVIINDSILSKIEFDTNDDSFKCKTLIVPVVDISGSMSGSPLNQVKYSLQRILDLTYANLNIVSSIISYSDNATTIDIDKNKSKDTYINYINGLRTLGGTSFNSAYKNILDLVKESILKVDINSIVFIFLTDGEDLVGKQSVNEFKQKFKDICTIQSTVHTIGFGNRHDYEFLNILRTVGCNEGAYRYANPNEDCDCLSNKLNTLLSVIKQTKSFDIEIVDDNYNLLFKDGAIFWFSNDVQNDSACLIKVNNKFEFKVKIELHGKNSETLKKEWYSHLVDDIASELLKIKTVNYLPLELNLHCELLKQRISVLQALVDTNSTESSRLLLLDDTVDKINKSETVDLMKLNDLKFEGKYQTTKSDFTVEKSVVPQICQYTTVQPFRNANNWEIIKNYKHKRSLWQKDSIISKVLGNYKTCNAIKWLVENEKKLTSFTESNYFKSNVLIVASSLGRLKIVKTLLDLELFDLSYVDSFGFNATDYAALYGYWQTLNILLEKGGKSTCDGHSLLRTCLNNKHYNVADILLRNKLSDVSNDLIENSPTNEIFSWLSNVNKVDIPITDAIKKGIYNVVLDKINSATFQPAIMVINMFTNPKEEHFDIFKLLLEKNLIDPFESIELDDEITWPFFIICEKGHVDFFNLTVELFGFRQDFIALLNRQNSKGTTVLWIASCNRHIEIVSNLLDLGADPNIVNNKGENSIIPCCQKGAVNIVDLLIASGAKIDLFDRNRDNSLLICCRNGQKDVLQLLLEQCKKQDKLIMLEQCAEIDGFNPIIASAESDKVECIKLCVQYGTNIEFKTEKNNQILAGATALHIACLYNKIASVKALYEQGADFKSQTDQGYTCMHIAVKQGHKNLVKYLLSLSIGKQLLETVDNNNKSPKYYCDDSMLEEFFTNKICKYLYNLLFCNDILIKKCVDIMINYGQSFGVFGYKDFIDLLIGNGNTLYSYALITRNEFLIDQIKRLHPSVNKVDDTAIDSHFWEVYMNYCDTNITDVINKVNKVNKISQLNSQNRFLTSLNKTPQVYNKEAMLKITDKMNDGYNNNITDTSINTIIAQSNKDIMLIGFLEKLKNSKNFSDGVQCLEYILWEAKIHILKMIANGEKMQPINLLSLYLISTNDNIFKQVNMSLKNWSRTNIWNPLCVCLYQSLKQLPNYVGEVYRAVDTTFSINDYKLGSCIVWNTFSTCSNENKPIVDYLAQNKGIIFIINSLTCKNISSYSTRPGDCGMMFLPGSRFIIKNYYKSSIIAICQKNIRSSTFKISDKDIEKATKGESSIIIELDEITK